MPAQLGPYRQFTLRCGCLQVAPSDYMKLLLKYVDAENIPEYLGGGWEARPPG